MAAGAIEKLALASKPTASRGFGELFGEAKSKMDDLQKNLASVIPAMPGLPVGKFFDLAIGIDFEPTIWPPFPLFPIPHVGMVFDLMAAIMSVVSSVIPEPSGKGGIGDTVCALLKGMAPSVKVYGKFIANAGIPIVHLPLLITHIPITKPIASSEMWMGSSIVLADGSPCSTQFHPALSCNLVGIPSIGRVKKPPKPKMSLMAPTSLLVITFASGGPVLVGGPPTIDLFQLALSLGIKGLTKAGGAGFQKIINQIDSDKFPKLKSILQKTKCKLFGEPVDAATGRVFADNIDFELPGPIPIRWGRTYYSDAEVETTLGYNWHHSYNMGLYDMENGFFTFRHADGRESVFPRLTEGDSYFDRKEQLTWSLENGKYVLEDSEKLCYRFSTLKNKDGYNVLSEIFTKDGFTIQFRYTGKGELFQIIDSRNQKMNVDTDWEGRILRVYTYTEGEGDTNLVCYRYDESGNMVETTDAMGVSKYFVYKEHLLVKLTNQSGMSFYWEYEGKGDNARCIHTWGDGGVLEYWTEYTEGLTLTKDSKGYTTQYYYDERKLIYKIIDANGGITHQSYNQHEELELVVDPEGLSTKAVYNECGNPIQQIDQNGESTLYKYDENKNLILAISPGGQTAQWEYDEYDRVTERIDTTGEKTRYMYEGALLTQIQDSEKRIFELRYDKAHNLEKLIYPNGLERTWKYDCKGQVTESIDVKGNIARFEYDRAGNLIRLEEPDGNVHHFSYDDSGSLIGAKDKLHEVSFTYGAMGILRSRSQNGRTVNFGYDNYLQLYSISNEGNEVYRFDLDGLGQVVKETGFDGLQREYIRNGLGQVTKILRPDNRWTEYTYDNIGNVIKEEQYDETFTAYRYNADGLLIEALNEEGKLEFKRDKAGRIIQERQGGHQVNHMYDKKGYLTKITSSLGADIDMSYNKEGDLEAMQACDKWQANWQRDNTGLELYRQLTGGVSIKTERDSFGRETHKSIGVRNKEQSSMRYRWGMGNRLQSIENELTGAHTNFDYDKYDNLIRADYNELNKQVETIYRAPDRIGNLFEKSDQSDRNYGRGGRLTEDPNYYYHYDVEGNLCFKEFKKNQGFTNFGKEAIEKQYKIKFRGSATGWLYDWSANGMLQKVINPEQGKIRFGYDALGRRTYKETKDKKTNWLWNGNIPLHEWYTHSVESLEEVITWIFEMGSFVPCAKIAKDKSYSIVTDYLGTPTQMYSNTGEKTWDCQLDIYGRVRTFEGSAVSDCPFRYQGQYEDSETGLYYNRFRYYDPSTGSYLSQDPIGLAGGNPTMYGYVKNPNLFVDIFGLSELVYQLLDSQGNVVYYGITSRTAQERLAEHAITKKGQFAQMEVLAEGLSHDQARSIEGALIRQRMDERLSLQDRMNLSIEEQLEKSGLLNKNRGRVKERWTSNNPLDEFGDKMHKKPKKVKGCH